MRSLGSPKKSENRKNSYYKDADGNEDKSKITTYGWEDTRPANVFTLRLQYKF